MEAIFLMPKFQKLIIAIIKGEDVMFGGSKVKLDKDLIERCKKHAEEVGYSSIEEFVTHVLERGIPKMPSPVLKALRFLQKLEYPNYLMK